MEKNSNYKTKTLELMNYECKNTLMETLDIIFTDFGDDFLEATMPVNSKVHQPLGLLHGGASCALLESVGSRLSSMLVDDNQEIRGIELSINHLRSTKEGILTATAKIIHKGRTLHLCEVKIVDQKNNLIAKGKISNIVINK